jgi:small-conductance mechanosensitive channel
LIGHAVFVAMLRLLAVLLVSLAVPSPAAAVWPFSSRGSAPAATAAPEGAITAPEVARRAEEAGKVLRDIDALLAPGPGVVAIQDRLPDLSARLAAQTDTTKRQLDEGPSTAAIDTLLTQWQTLRGELSTYVNVLAERGTAIERGLGTLTALRETWTRARTDVRASKAPAQVVDRIDGILTAVATTRTRLQEERGATLLLQDRVAQHVAQCDAMLERLGTARLEMAGRLLVQDGVPLWRLEQLATAVTELPGRVRDAAQGAVSEIGMFAGDRRVRIAVNIALFAALAVVTYTARRTARGLTSDLDGRAATIAVLDRPLAAALLLTVLANSFSSGRPRIVQALGEVIVLVLAVRVVQSAMDPRRLVGLYSVGGLLLADLVRRLSSTVPLLEQQIFLVEAAGVIFFLAWQLGVRKGRPAIIPPGTAWDRAVPFALTGALVAFVGAGIACAAGYVRLALFIGSGILGSVFVALALYGSLQVAGALVAVGLSCSPFRDLWMVRRHRPFLERRLGSTLRWLAIGGWVVLVLRHWGLLGSAGDFVKAALEAELQAGAVSISLGAVLAFVITIAATFVLSGIVRFVLLEEISPRRATERALPYVVSTLVHYTLILAGFLLALAALGVDLTKITIVAGALGVGIGFGLQGLVNNFVSGLVILSERRINVGDAVQIGDVGGRVEQLGIRACLVRTWEGAEVIVPNASLVTEKVTNWTLSDRLRRIDVPVGVAYGTSPEKVADVLIAVARKHADVMADPAPVVFFRGFGDSALQFELQAWTNRFERWAVARSEVAAAAYAALREASIEIPFPQREVRLRSEQAPEHRPA